MKDASRRLCAALDGDGANGAFSDGDQELLALAAELSDAFSTLTLNRADRDRLLTHALTMAGAADARAPRARIRGPLSRLAGRAHSRRLGILLPRRGVAPRRGVPGPRPTGLPRLGPRASALLGGTAVVALAAIGITVVHQRRPHGSAAA